MPACPPNVAPSPSLSARDRAVAALTGQGVSHKVIAIELSIAPSTVSHVVGRLRERFGAASRMELLVKLFLLDPPCTPARPLAPLTCAEQETVRLVLEGRSNAEIARARCVSVRTVANQVASAYRRLGVGSRAELAALYARTAPSAQSQREASGAFDASALHEPS